MQPQKFYRAPFSTNRTVLTHVAKFWPIEQFPANIVGNQ